MSATTTGARDERVLMEGSEALARAAIAAGCRFFAGYPMTPFTEVLEHMAKRLPRVGGVCMNAESELEAIGMVWGAAATGVRAATGSTGQGLSLMQESLAEITLARLPLVVLNMAGAVSHAFIRKYRRIMIFLVFVFAGAATPSPDPFSMLLLAVPCVILVELAELFVWLNDRRRARRDAALLASEGLSEVSEDTNSRT